MTTFSEKEIDVTIQLGKGDFGASGFNTETLTGLRVSVALTKGGDPTLDKLSSCRVWGMTPSQMNLLSTLGRPPNFDRVNIITLQAGDASAKALVFSGVIQEAYQDFSDSPQSCMNFVANVGLVSAAKPIPPLSYLGQADIATVAQAMAAQLTPGCTLENNGVSGQLSTPYFAGTALDQLRRLKEQGYFDFTIDGNVLAIWPKGQPRNSATVVDLSPETGLLDYPSFAGSGFVSLKALYNPSFRVNGKFNLTTSITAAQGSYSIVAMLLELESQVIGGKWDASIRAYRPPLVTP